MHPIKKYAISLGSFVLFLIIIPASAHAADYYVATDGNDSNNGTLASPFKTIQKGLNTANAGDTVFVRAGTYREKVFFPRSGDAANGLIALKAYPQETPILQGSGSSTAVSISNKIYIHVDGFEITNYETAVELASVQHIILSDLHLHHNLKFGIDGNTATASEFAYNTIHNTGTNTSGYSGININHLTDSSIHHNKVSLSRHNGIMISYGSDRNQIYNNTAFENSCGDDQRYAGIAIEVDSEFNKVYNNLVYNNCHGGYVSNSPNNEIYHNLIYGNYEEGGSGSQIMLGDWVSSSPQNNIFKNNILVVTRLGDNAIGMGVWDGINYDPLSNSFENNLYYSTVSLNPGNLVSISAGNVHGNFSFSQWQGMGKDKSGKLANPQFINPSNFDFHLLGNSPAIDSGTPVGVDKDFDGLTRPAGLGVDIGAYEFPSASPSPSPFQTPSPSPTSTPTPTPTPHTVTGDANADGKVDGQDYIIWLDNYGKTDAGVSDGDFNTDSLVTGADYLIWIDNYST